MSLAGKEVSDYEAGDVSGGKAKHTFHLKNLSEREAQRNEPRYLSKYLSMNVINKVENEASLQEECSQCAFRLSSFQGVGWDALKSTMLL